MMHKDLHIDYEYLKQMLNQKVIKMRKTIDSDSDSIVKIKVRLNRVQKNRRLYMQNGSYSNRLY